MADMTFKIGCGFLVKEVVTTMSLKNAYELLLTDERMEYFKLCKGDKGVNLYKHILSCPLCGNKFVAHPHKVTRTEFINSRISDWLNGQVSFFSDTEEIIYFAEENYKSICPDCGYMGTISGDYRTVSACGDSSAVILSCELKGIDETSLDLSADVIKASVTLSLYETLEFNFVDGAVYIRVKDSSGNLLGCEDITYKYRNYTDCILLGLVEKNGIAKGSIRQLFERAGNGLLPFHKDELCLEKYVMMTTFVGYSRAFYDCIPYEISSDEIDKSFKFDMRLKHSAEIGGIYKKTCLPDVKSVRRIFFKNPGLFFYIDECEMLWEITSDINVFCRLISEKGIFHILSMLHIYPGVEVFCRDYCKIKGAKKLCTALADITRLLIPAIEYYAMNNHQREKQRQKWTQTRVLVENSCVTVIPDFTVLMNMGEIPVECAVVDGYRFALLHTFKEYVAVGKTLNNCLTEWSPDKNPVVAIYRNNSAIAAVELKGNKAVQIRGSENRRIRANEPLANAFKKWCGILNIKFKDHIIC